MILVARETGSNRTRNARSQFDNIVLEIYLIYYSNINSATDGVLTSKLY